MLDERRLPLDHPWCKDLAFGQLVVFEELVFMRVARVRAFQQHHVRLGLPDNIGDFGERHITLQVLAIHQEQGYPSAVLRPVEAQFHSADSRFLMTSRPGSARGRRYERQAPKESVSCGV